MNTDSAVMDTNMTDVEAHDHDDDEAFWRSQLILEPADESANSEIFPRLRTMSPRFMFQAVLRAEKPEPAEYLTIPLSGLSRDEKQIELELAVAQWNMQWEAAQFRRRLFDERDLPAPLYEVADRGDINIVFVPRTKTRYFELAPLVHMLPKAALERYRLPLLRTGLWPYLMDTQRPDRYLPADFEVRVSQAWASVVWSHVFHHKSPLSGFSATDPIRLLAHNLDYWLPAATEAIQSEMREWPELDEGIEAHPVRLEDGSGFEGAVRANPRPGGDVWCGEAEAKAMVMKTIEMADRHGRFREILDAIRSNRVEEDFSERWTTAREDFERKLYHKRLKVKVRFVELTDAVPVQGPETEIVGHTVCSDFLALLNARDREVVILLSSGYTKLTDIAEIMGYSNHSPISKRLDRIRRQAAKFFDIDQSGSVAR